MVRRGGDIIYPVRCGGLLHHHIFNVGSLAKKSFDRGYHGDLRRTPNQDATTSQRANAVDGLRREDADAGHADGIPKFDVVEGQVSILAGEEIVCAAEECERGNRALEEFPGET